MEFLYQHKNIIIGAAVVVLALFVWWMSKDTYTSEELPPLPHPQNPQTLLKPTLVMFYSKGCPPSIAAVPAFKSASDELVRSGAFDAVEVTIEDDQESISTQKIESFPTFRLYPAFTKESSRVDYNKEFVQYPNSGNRSIESLLTFVYSEGKTA